MNPTQANLSPLFDGQNRLRQDFKAFSQVWVATKDDWRDGRRTQLEREHLQALGPSLARLSAMLDQFRDFVIKSDRELADSMTED